MSSAWDLSHKKWLYWTGLFGFVLSTFVMWFISFLLYLMYDRKKPKTQNYQIDKVYGKFVIVVGNLTLVILLIIVVVLIVKKSVFG